MDRLHPVRGEDFTQFAETATLGEFAPSVRLIGRETDCGPIVVRYQYYIAGPAAADEAFLQHPRNLIPKIARDEKCEEFESRCYDYSWTVEIFTPIGSIVYLYDLAHRVAAQLPDLSTAQILTHWERTSRVVVDIRGQARYYTRPVEALMLAHLTTEFPHPPELGGYPRTKELFPDFDRANPTVELAQLPRFGYEERSFDLDEPPHAPASHHGSAPRLDTA